MSDKNTSYKVKIQVMLDKAKSLKNLKTGIKSLASKVTVKVKAALDGRAAQKEFSKNLKGILPKININVDTSKIMQKIRQLGKQKTELVIQPDLDKEKIISGLKDVKKEADTILDELAQAGVKKSVEPVKSAEDSSHSTEKESSIKAKSAASIKDITAILPDFKEVAEDMAAVLEKCGLLESSLLKLEQIKEPKDLLSLPEKFMNAAKSTGHLTSVMHMLDHDLSTEHLNAVGQACIGLSDSQLRVVLSANELEESHRLAILAGMGMEEQAARQRLAALGLSEAEDAAALSAFSFQGALKAVKTALASNPIGFIMTAITTAVTVVQKVMSYQQQQQEKAAQALKDAEKSIEEFHSKIDDMNKTFFEHKTTVDEAKESYAALAKGVDTFHNKNITLNSEDYEKFISINNKLAEIFPELKTGIDGEGNAILNLGDNADIVAEKLDALIQKEERANARDIWKNLSDQFSDVYTKVYHPEGNDGLLDQVKANEKAIASYEKLFHSLKNDSLPDEEVWDPSDDAVYEYYKFLKKEYDEYIDSVQGMSVEAKGMLKAAMDVGNITDEFFLDTTHVERVIQNFHIKSEDLNLVDIQNQLLAENSRHMETVKINLWELQSDNDSLQEQVNAYWGEYRDAMSQGMIGAYQYINAENDEQRKIMQQLVDNLDASTMETIQEKYNGNTTDFLNNEVFGYADKIEEATKDLGFRFSDLFDMSVSADSLSVKWERIKEYFDKNHISINWDLISKDDDIEKTNKQFTQLLWDSDKNGTISSEEENKRYQDSLRYQKELSHLTLEQKKKYMEINQGVQDINEQMANWKKYQKDIKKSSFDISSPFSSSDIIDTFSGMTEGAELLNNIYTDIADGGEFDFTNLTTGKFAENFEGMEEEYHQFIETIASSPNDIESCQKAFNQLVTAWIDSKGILKEVSHETKELTINMLEKCGVTNAAALVEAELAKQEAAEFLSKQDLAHITGERINNLLQEADSAGIVRSELYELMLQEINFNNSEINSKDKIAALDAIAEAALGTAAALSLEQYATEQARYKTSTVGETGESTEDYYAAYYKERLEYLLKTAKEKTLSQYRGKTPSSTAGSKPSSATDSPQEKEPTVETFNFLETLLSRLSNAFDKLKAAGENTFQTLTARAKDYDTALENIDKQIGVQQQAYHTYMEKASAVGLDEYWASQVRDGSLNLVDITDDGLKEKIKAYQEWFEKALACSDALAELNRQQTELKQAKIELQVKEYDNIIEKLSGKGDRIQGRIDLKEAWGFSASKVNYKDLNKAFQEQIKYTKKQQEELKKLMATVAEGSEAWYEYKQRMDENNASIQEMTKSMAENAKAAAALAGERATAKAEKQDGKMELYDAKAGNATTAKQKNKQIDKKMSAIDKKQDAYNAAVTKDKKNLDKAKKNIKNWKSTKENASILKSVRNYTKSGKKIPKKLLDKAIALNDNGKFYNACIQYNSYLDSYTTDKATAELFAQTSKQEKAELALEKFGNISTEYDNKMAADEQKKASIENQISLAEQQGKKPTTSYYKDLLSIETAEQDHLTKKREALQKALDDAVANGTVAQGSDEWYQMSEEINSVANALAESALSAAEYKNQIRQIEWDAFDKGMETVKRLGDETEYYLDLLEKEKMTDENGNFTDYGKAALALHKANYESYLAQAEGYAKEYQRLMDTADLSDEKVIERMRQFEEAHRDARLSMGNEKQAIADLIREGYDAQLDSLSELIQKYKDLKRNQKESYDYQKTISEKTKNISALQKQLQAYEDNDTEETKAKIQKLRVELEEAQQDLEETEYDKYLSDMDNMLDELYNEYETFVNEKLSQTNTILQDISGLIGDTNSVLGTLNDLAAGIGNGGSVSAPLAGAVTGQTSAAAYTDAAISAETAAANSPSAVPPTETQNNAADTGTASADILTPLEQQYNSRPQVEMSLEEKAKLYIQTHGHITTKKKDQFRDLNQAIYENKEHIYSGKKKVLNDKEIGELAKILGVKHDNNNKTGQVYKKLQSFEWEGFANGSKHIEEDKLALTQERGEELIYDASGSSMLTPLGKGDMVFTDKMSKNLWDISQIPMERLIKNVHITSIFPDIPAGVYAPSNQQNYGSIHIDMGGITMYGVNDPESFAQELNRQLSSNPQTIGILQNQSVEIMGSSHNSFHAARHL